MSLDNGYIKLWRSMLTWEWYDDPPTLVVYVYLILSANIDQVLWHGIDIPRGSLVSSYSKIAKRKWLKIRQAKRRVNAQTPTGKVTRSAYPKFPVFTRNNYDKFQEATSKTQGKRSNTDKQTDKQPTSNRQRNKKDKKNKKEEYIYADAQQENDVRIFPPGGDF